MLFAPHPVGPSVRLLKSASVSAASEAIIGDFTSEFHTYLVLFEDLQSSSDNDTLILRVSTDNGSTFDSGAGHYAWNNVASDNNGSLSSTGSAADTEINLRASYGTASLKERTTSGRLYIFRPVESGQFTKIHYHAARVNSSGTHQFITATGQREAQQADNAIELLWSTGNITVRYDLYGIK